MDVGQAPVSCVLAPPAHSLAWRLELWQGSGNLMWGLEQHLNKPCRALLAVADILWLLLLVWHHPSRLMLLLCCDAFIDTQGGGQPQDAGLVAASEVVN